MKEINLVKSFSRGFKRGFTLIELLVVVGIIAIIVAVVLVSLNTARNKGADGAIKSNLVNAIKQGEIFWNTNTASPNSYTNVCTVGPVPGALTVFAGVTAAAKAAGIPAFTLNNSSLTLLTTATCNNGPNGWAAEVPLKAATGSFWCVDSTGKSLQTPSALLAGATDYSC
jgi:prepilin-type N-terminal cleavage/methylation domain-containing protein